MMWLVTNTGKPMHGVSIQITWIVLSVIAGMFIGYVAVRAICYFLVRANLVPCKKRLSDIRFFQNDAERARAKIIAAGLEHKFKEGIPSFTMVGPQFVAAVMNDDHTSIEIEPPRTEERHPRAHWPVFRLAVDGRIGTSSLVVSDVPNYTRACRLPTTQTSERPAEGWFY
ncbi:unnamed protein product, partial [Mesorhabditis belari]|uniref:Uncharacterized protein n=1 Tax=Mesorhabditis belari TaxID=2138241 RepID=A0AAF3FC54_9BILA